MVQICMMSQCIYMYLAFMKTLYYIYFSLYNTGLFLCLCSTSGVGLLHCVILHVYNTCLHAWLISGQSINSVTDVMFMCKRCDGTIQEADLAGDLVVDEVTYRGVKSFCYLRNSLAGDGGAHLAARLE